MCSLEVWRGVGSKVAMFLHADGINFHGYVKNSLVDYSYIQTTGDDIYAVWGSPVTSQQLQLAGYGM